MVLQPVTFTPGEIGDLEDDDAIGAESDLSVRHRACCEATREATRSLMRAQLLRRACGRHQKSRRRPESTWPTRPATRTMKNPSRLLAEIERNLSRSSSG